MELIPDAQPKQGCTEPVKFWNYTYVAAVEIRNSLFVGNVATCKTCTGGALHVHRGGYLRVVDTTFVNNSAGLFGGGLSFGLPTGPSMCGISLQGVLLAGNSAPRGGAQVHSTCKGDVRFEDTMVMQSDAGDQSQVGPLFVYCVDFFLVSPTCVRVDKHAMHM